MAEARLCSIPDCGKIVHCRSLCIKHYRRFMGHGDPLKEPKHIDARQYLEETVIPYKGNDCLTWPFSRVQFGYGRIHIDGTTYRVHRLVCGRINGSAPSDKPFAAHTCGNGHLGCVNPNHIRWASRKENGEDMAKHGRSLRGEKNPTALLDKNKVREIRLLKGKKTLKEIAAEYNVNFRTVSRILRNEIWTWVT